MLKFALIVVCVYLVKYSFTFPSGAPVSTCETMTPSHSGARVFSTGLTLFNITLSNRTNSSIDVNLVSKSGGFKGFILQARRPLNRTSVGKWFTDVTGTKTLDCFDLEDSAVTHNIRGLNTEFTNLKFTWFYPLNQNLDGVYFVATVVKSYDMIYMNVTRELNLNDF